MTDRDFLIAFERQAKSANPDYGNTFKLNSDTIYYFINKAKDDIVSQLYRQFQRNQELSDNIRNLVKVTTITTDLVDQSEYQFTQYPLDYLYTVGENVSIKTTTQPCAKLKTKPQGVIEATVDTFRNVLNNSLSEHRLHYGQAKPVRVFADSQIRLYNDGNYKVEKYELTYIRKPKQIGTNPSEEYTDLPSTVHDLIVDTALQKYAVRQKQDEQPQAQPEK